ncbi:MAG: serine/threonine-protein kinase, partial [Bdellovibrionales bacterium]
MEEDQLQSGDWVDSYRIVRKIGFGGMAEVYEAWEEVLQRRIAIKILSTDANSNPDLVKRFQAEGRALARLNHDNIVNIYTLGEYNGHAYMAMEYIDGWTLDVFLQMHFCGFQEILRLFRHMLEGLAAAHDAGIIHRDLKPQNVMVDRSMCVKLVDFGIAKLNEEHSNVQTATGMLIGTLNYIAPELFDGAEATKQSDVYSLGLVLYFMLAGESPFSAKARLEVMEKIATVPLSLGANCETILPAGLKSLMDGMTSKFLPKRYRGAREALRALSKVDLASIPQEFRAAVPPQLHIANLEEVRKQSKKQGLDNLEIQLVGCLAAQFTLKAQSLFERKESISISDQALAEASKRYASAKRKMMLKVAYWNAHFMLAMGACAGAVII